MIAARSSARGARASTSVRDACVAFAPRRVEGHRRGDAARPRPLSPRAMTCSTPPMPPSSFSSTSGVANEEAGAGAPHLLVDLALA